MPAELLSTFASVVGYIERSGRPCSVNDARDLLQLRHQEPQLSCTVSMRPLVTSAGRTWLALSSPVCPLGRVHLRGALLANEDLPFGALADWEGTMLLRQTLPLPLGAPHLDAAILAIARLAAQLAATAAAVATTPSTNGRFAYLFR